jgi:hypothetical protein
VSDRRNKVLQFRKAAKDLFKPLSAYVVSIADQVGSFDLTRSHGSNQSVPTGLEQVAEHTFSIVARVSGHQASRGIHYNIVSRGDECVVLRRTTSSGKGAEHPSSDWVEILCYAGMQPPAPDLLIDDFKRWLSVSLKTLGDEILGGH